MKVAKTAASSVLGSVAGTGEGQPADPAAQARQEEEARAAQAREETAAAKVQSDAAAKEKVDAAAKAQEDAVAQDEAARQAEADAGATGGAAGQDTPGSYALAAGQTAMPDAPPAGGWPDDHGNEGGGRAATATTEGEVPPPSTEAAPESPGTMVLTAAGTLVLGRSPGPRPAGSGTSAGSAPQLQWDWASTSEVSSGTAPVS